MIGTVYKISSGLTDKIYIGSTIRSVAKRFQAHKTQYKRKLLRCTSKVLFDLGDVSITELACCKFNNKQELRDIEYSIMKQYSDLCVNFQGTKDRKSPDYCKKWHALHPKTKEQIFEHNNSRPKTKHCDICNKDIGYTSFSKHTKTKKHLDKVL